MNSIRVMGTRLAGEFLQSALLIVYRFCQANGIQKCIFWVLFPDISAEMSYKVTMT